MSIYRSAVPIVEHSMNSRGIGVRISKIPGYSPAGWHLQISAFSTSGTGLRHEVELVPNQAHK